MLLEKAVADIEGMSVVRPAATYLAWVFVSSSLSCEPKQWLEQAGVEVMAGAEYGDSEYVRINFGVHRKHLLEAIKRIRAAVG